MIGSFEDIVESFEKKKALRGALRSQLKELKDQLSNITVKIESLEKARAILQVIAKETQGNLEFHVSGLGTLALKSVDADWPEYVAKFTTRKNKPECDIVYKEKGKEQPPLESAGGGCADIGSFAGMLSYWNLKPTAPIFLLDEPFRNVSPDYHNKTSEMVKRISKELKVQIIMVSHADGINIAADRTFHARSENGFFISE
jgi:DNA repair exonuclease SbcCD ATPase subunit